MTGIRQGTPILKWSDLWSFWT